MHMWQSQNFFVYKYSPFFLRVHEGDRNCDSLITQMETERKRAAGLELKQMKQREW